MLILDCEIILYIILFKSAIISEPHKTDFHFWFRIPICFHWRIATFSHRMKKNQIKQMQEIQFTIWDDPSDPSNSKI